MYRIYETMGAIGYWFMNTMVFACLDYIKNTQVRVGATKHSTGISDSALYTYFYNELLNGFYR